MVTKVSSYVLANTAVTTGTYGGSNQNAVVTIDQQGRITYAANVTQTTTIADDNTTDSTRYLTFSTGTGGQSTLYVSTTNLSYNPNTGIITATSFSATSDERLKKDILTITDALNTVNNLRGVKYTLIDSNVTNIGVIAQEIEKYVPEVVTEVNGIKTVSYGNIVGLLIEAVKELNKKVEMLENNK